MRIFFFFIMLGLSSSSCVLGQDTTIWYIQGGFANWEVMLDNKAFDLRTTLSLGQQLGSRYLLGVGMMNHIEGRWPSQTGSTSWNVAWFPSWIGVEGRIYLKEINRSNQLLNPYLEAGLGGILWSSFQRDPVSGVFERITFADLAWSMRAGASIWLKPALSLDLQGSYFPYALREASPRNHIRPHELFIALSLGYWIEKNHR